MRKAISHGLFLVAASILTASAACSETESSPTSGTGGSGGSSSSGPGGMGGTGGTGGTSTGGGGSGGALPTGVSASWAKSFGDAAKQYATTMAVDGKGHVLIGGTLEGTVDFGGGPLVSGGKGDVFLAAFDGAGAHLWSKRFGATTMDLAGIAADAAGNVVIAGDFTGDLDLGGGALTSASINARDVFLAKLDATGAHQWSKRFGDTAADIAGGVGIDGTGAIYLTGWFGGSIDLGGGALPQSGFGNVFLARFDGAGAHVWSKRFGGDASDAAYASGLAVDPAGNTAIVGRFGGKLGFGATDLTALNTKDDFVARFSPAGDAIWARSFDIGGMGVPLATLAVAAGADGSVVVGGNFFDQPDLGGGPLTSAGGDIFGDAFVAKWSADGAHVYSHAYGDFYDEAVSSVAVDAQGHAYVTGIFTGEIDFGKGALVPGSTIDMFVARLDPSGKAVWSAGYGNVITAYACALDASNDVFLAGQMTDTASFDAISLIGAGEEDAFVVKLTQE